MAMLRHILDSFLSLVAAILAAAIAFLPAWYAHMAIDSGLASRWIYLAIAGLIFVGCVVSFAFLRKAKDGVSPFRERRRR
ncbi:MAG: hypothetical protein COB40_08590 [Marinosulfonomonas sp.]|nr:MAG: hypothetical protein COB40_08590 [Marinosulfonomonas sp.]